MDCRRERPPRSAFKESFFNVLSDDWTNAEDSRDAFASAFLSSSLSLSARIESKGWVSSRTPFRSVARAVEVFARRSRFSSSRLRSFVYCEWMLSLFGSGVIPLLHRRRIVHRIIPRQG